jgi:Protein of unknown function (DUF968)
VRGCRRRPEKGPWSEWVILSLQGQQDPVDWCTAMRRQIESTGDTEALRTFWMRNAAVLEMLRQNRPDLRAGDGRHFADILTAQFHTQVNRKPSESQRSNGAAGIPSIDAHSPDATNARPRRVLNRDHLRFVASRPCLVCGRAPCRPHHIRFAQVRALGSKAGDQWTVPLCNTHHRALHDVGDKQEWWSAQGIDPMGETESLWQSRKNDRSGGRA